MKKNSCIYLIVLFCLTISSCKGPLEQLLGQIDEAIEQVKKTRVSVIHESINWRNGILELEKNVSDDVSKIIKEDIREMGLDLIQDGGAELRCNADFIESKIISYLDAVLKALEEIRDKAERDGKLDDSLDIILSNMIDKRSIIVPYACHNNDYQVICEENGEGLKLLSENPIAEIIGFGFQRPLSEYKLQLLDINNNITDSFSGDTYLSNPTPYMLAVRIEDIPLKKGQKTIRIVWNEWKVSEFIITVADKNREQMHPELVVLKYIIRPQNAKPERVSLGLELEINGVSVPYARLEEVGRGIRYSVGDRIEVPAIGVFVNIKELERIVVRIEMEKLPQTGNIVDMIDLRPYPSANSHTPAIPIKKYLEKGYVREGWDLKLYKYPPTVLQNWKGTIEPIWLVGNNEKRFTPIGFEFKDNKYYAVAEWTPEGMAID